MGAKAENEKCCLQAKQLKENVRKWTLVGISWSVTNEHHGILPVKDSARPLSLLSPLHQHLQLQPTPLLIALLIALSVLGPWIVKFLANCLGEDTYMGGAKEDYAEAFVNHPKLCIRHMVMWLLCAMGSGRGGEKNDCMAAQSMNLGRKRGN